MNIDRSLKFEMNIDLSLKNEVLYKGCEITEVGGRLTLVNDPAEAANIVRRNAIALIESTSAEERDEVILTGPMAAWAYLVVFHQVVHKFRKVVYDDGRGGTVMVVAQH